MKITAWIKNIGKPFPNKYSQQQRIEVQDDSTGEYLVLNIFGELVDKFRKLNDECYKIDFDFTKNGIYKNVTALKGSENQTPGIRYENDRFIGKFRNVWD